MSTRQPKISKLLVPGKTSAELETVVTSITVNYSTGQVAELTLEMVDQGLGILKDASTFIGSTITFEEKPWQIGSVDYELTDSGATLSFRCRDPLAKKLRVTYKTSAEKKVSPGEWVTRRVRVAKGKPIVQASSKRGTIAQSKNQSVLDVIGNLASDLEWDWTSYDNTFIFGSRFFAWQGSFNKLSTWAITWQTDPRSDAIAASGSDSDDNTDNKAELDVELDYDYGVNIRPWHRLQSTIPGAKGMWLVEDVEIKHDGVTPVRIRASKPKKPSPKAGSSNKEN